ncbi:MAG: glycosyltransferase family 2 protein, partial [Bacteroidaceae bacterium]|nr:glycosyltransferase family 2 protein [Bacteroidaceae bacterium]
MERKGYFCTSKYYFRMEKLLIITPVKDSIQTTLDTIHAIMESGISVPYTYTIYNDNSTPENTAILEKEAEKYGFRLVNICDLTDHPSPNYLLVLQMAQEEALAQNAGLCIVESDVTVKPDTLQRLFDGAKARKD